MSYAPARRPWWDRWLDPSSDFGSWLPAVGMALIFFPPGWWRLLGLFLWLALDVRAISIARIQRERRRLLMAVLVTVGTATLGIQVLLNPRSAILSGALWTAVELAFVAWFILARDEWLRVISWSEVIRFLVWSLLLAAVSLIGTVVVVHQAQHHVHGHTSFPYVSGSAALVVIAILALAAGGGLAVFRSSWMAVLIGATLGGLIPWSVLGITSSAMGAMKANGVGGLCVTHHNCTEFAYVAGFIVATSPLMLAPIFAGSFAAKKLPAIIRTRRSG